MTIPDMMYCERSVESMVTPSLQEKDSEISEDQKVKGMEWHIGCLSIPLIQSSSYAEFEPKAKQILRFSCSAARGLWTLQ
jgi:hypothetical protein